MMSHMFVEVDDDVHAQDEVILYNIYALMNTHSKVLALIQNNLVR